MRLRLDTEEGRASDKVSVLSESVLGHSEEKEKGCGEGGLKRGLRIGSREIGDGCYVIAEIGSNHMGEVGKALEMVAAAEACGVNGVKFQKRDNRGLFTREFYDSGYESEVSFGATYGEHREALELDEEEFRRIRDRCLEVGVDLIITPFDFKSADFCMKLGVDAFKIASADLVNTPLLERVALYGKPVLVSTGGGTIEDVDRAYGTLKQYYNPGGFALLQCTASYPVEIEEMNLGVIKTYLERYPDVVIGLSDHQSGIAMALVGWCLGARIIEKHFTLHRAWKGTDQAFSLEPEGMRRLVRDLRRAPLAIGDGIKRVLPCEGSAIRKMGKMIVAGVEISEGQLIESGDIAFRSPQDGLPPYMWEQIVGKKSRRRLVIDEPILLEDVS